MDSERTGKTIDNIVCIYWDNRTCR